MGQQRPSARPVLRKVRPHDAFSPIVSIRSFDPPKCPKDHIREQSMPALPGNLWRFRLSNSWPSRLIGIVCDDTCPDPSLREEPMRRIVFALVAVVALAGAASYMAPASGQSGRDAAPIFGINMPPGYRDWKLISVAHEAGDLNDLRAILGNDVAIKAYREGTLPFPDGTIIARLAWTYVPSEENNKVFGHPQSFVAGPPKEGVQFMVKDSSKYASANGWGFAQFDDGKPAAEAVLKGCSPCHEPAKASDFVYTRYGP